MNITQKQLYDDYIKARKLGERGNRIDKALLNINEFCGVYGDWENKGKRTVEQSEKIDLQYALVISLYANKKLLDEWLEYQCKRA